ncbi:MAG: carboxymuconolactone decarboxylase family protein [Henriciella sp.]|nr:carboxymuconolactone decarboxylase family protein [Henriciella sp.]
MTRIPAASPEQLDQSKDLLALAAAAMGFEANSLKVMARNPSMLQGFMALSGAILGPGASLDPVLRQMIAHITSAAAGCAYCQAHTAHGAEHRGMDQAKLDALWDFETSSLFTEAERAALDLALAAGSVPNQSTDAHFEALRAHYSEDEITEIVGVIALFGFLNRWNDTLATTLEDNPLAFATSQLAPKGWNGDRHNG